MSSLESRKLTLEVSEFALSDLVRGASADVSHIAEQHHSKVCCFIDPSLPEKVIGDAIRLREVLSTLLLTALSSAQSAQIHLSVFASGERSLELDLTFEINAGSQAKNAQLHQLPQIKKTVDLLGGDLGLEERRDATPVFWCRFPFQRPPFTSDTSAKPRPDHEHAFPVPCKYPVRILMAEDNSINQRVGKLILQRAGYQVDLVSDGSEALEAHRAAPYDLILMDCQMPTMDGFEATRQIRSISLRQPIIIAVTANALVGERERCLAAGMDDYLSKPFQAEQLVAIVERWAEGVQQRA